MIWSLLSSFVGRPERIALQWSIRDVTNALTRISLLDCERDGRSLEMLQIWKKAVRVMFFMWGANERVLSRMTPRLLTWLVKDTGKPSIMMLGGGVVRILERVFFEPMSRASVLLPFSFRKFLLIQLLISWRQVVREVGGRAVLGLVEI